MPDYIPTPDNDFLAWEQRFARYANNSMPALGLAPGELDDVNAAQGDWVSAWFANTDAQDDAEAARQAKDAARATYETLIRALVKRLQASAAVDDSERAALGITVRDAIRTAASVPISKPVTIIDARTRLQHSIAFADEGTPTKRSKPSGVMGCEIWIKIGGDPPVDPREVKFLALDTATPYVVTFTGADAGKSAHYMLRWVNSRGEKGPWSATVSATIPG